MLQVDIVTSIARTLSEKDRWGFGVVEVARERQKAIGAFRLLEKERTDENTTKAFEAIVGFHSELRKTGHAFTASIVRELVLLFLQSDPWDEK